MANDPTQATLDANQAVAASLPFSDEQSYTDAWKNLITQVTDLVIQGPNDEPAWSLLEYQDQMGYNYPSQPPPPCPDTVNPSLWRIATLNSVAGLFKVCDGIYQVRAFDMSNMTIVEGDAGLLIIDPLISTECARAALQLYRDHSQSALAQAPVKTIIYTHSHVDHFGGVRGVMPEDGSFVEILAPSGFLEHAVSENVYAGMAMSRRAQYMYGPYLARGHRGQVDCGLGKNQSTGTVSLLPPTRYIEENGYFKDENGDVLLFDGLSIYFQLTPGSEAPAEMNFYFDKYRALCAAENTTHNMHNIQTLRGARVRDSLIWSKYLHEALGLFGDKTDVLFAQHHWPVWGGDTVKAFLRQQRDLYRYLNDQTLRLLNKGYTGIEIAESFTVPPGLDQDWSCRGYYGTLSHNVKGVYDRYMGWFDGNPSTLHALPPSECAQKYVDAIGSDKTVIEVARAAYEEGDYRWAAQVLTHAVFADPADTEAKALQADAFEQLGYQAEAATWRNFYLMGAQELRGGVQPQQSTSSDDFVEQLTLEMVFDLIATLLVGPRAAAKNLVMSWVFDTGERCVTELSNGALSFTRLPPGQSAPESNLTVTLERSALNELLLGESSLESLMIAGRLTISPAAAQDDFFWFCSLLDGGDPNFPIVTPKEPDLPTLGAAGSLNKAEIKARTRRFARPLLRGC